MRLSEIGNKEIVDLSKGSRHGQLWDAEMLFDQEKGTIKAVLVPGEIQNKRFLRSSQEQWQHLPWGSIVTIGDDMIIFKSEESEGNEEKKKSKEKEEKDK